MKRPPPPLPVHVTVTFDPAAICALRNALREDIMAVSEQIQAFSDRVDVATSAIAAKIQALTDKIKAGTPLSPEDVAVLDAEAAKLEAMGKDPENPV